MGSLGKIAGNALGGIIKTVAPAILQAVAPAASSLLKGITGDLFSKGAGFLKNALAASPLPNPLKALGEKLLGSGLEKLTKFAEGGIDKALAKLTDMVTKRFAPDAGNISPAPLNTRLAEMAANNPAVAAASAAATAVTGSTGSTSGSSSSAATANTSGGAVSGGPTGASSAPNSPPDMPTNWEDRAQVEKYQRGMQAFQAAMQGMQAYFTMMSNIIKSQGDTAKSVIGNLR